MITYQLPLWWSDIRPHFPCNARQDRGVKCQAPKYFLREDWTPGYRTKPRLRGETCQLRRLWAWCACDPSELRGPTMASQLLKQYLRAQPEADWCKGWNAYWGTGESEAHRIAFRVERALPKIGGELWTLSILARVDVTERADSLWPWRSDGCCFCWPHSCSCTICTLQDRPWTCRKKIGETAKHQYGQVECM